MVNESNTHGAEKPLLIKTNTCPACRTATAALDGAGVDYDIITDSDAGYNAAVERYGVRHVPTLILRTEAGWQSLTGTDAIRTYIRERERRA